MFCIMIDLILNIESISFDSTIYNLYPVIKDEITKDKNSLITKLINKLQNEAPAVLLSVLSYIDDKDRIILCENLILRYDDKLKKLIVDLINRYLKEDIVNIKNLYINKNDDDTLKLTLSGIDISYYRLLNNEIIKTYLSQHKITAPLRFIISKATKASPSAVEYLLCKYINDNKNSKKITGMLEKILNDNKISLKLNSINVLNHADLEQKNNIDISILENIILDAVAKYLKSKI